MINLLRNVRQWRYPKEFRIGEPVWSYDLLPALQRLSDALSTPATSSSTLDETTYARILADVATGLWRLRQRMLQPGTDEPREEMRRAYLSFESAWDALMEAGITIQDHTDSAFNAGLLLRVLAFQPTPGIVRETVIETVRPSIYYKQQLLQPGEVIVGTPEMAETLQTLDNSNAELNEQAPVESLDRREQGDSADDQINH